MRKVTVIIWLFLLFGTIAALFWRNEWVYNLPTPIPENYEMTKAGKIIDLPEQIRTNNNPTFLHFFNPRCPCSRFNMPHFKSLVKEYGGKINFVIVVMSNKEYSVKEIQNKFNLAIPVLFDTSITACCGVYSTPQAVLIDENRRLFYRGNYNRTRYCTDKKSEYAKIAINALLQHTTNIFFDKHALIAYGCQLPKCTN